jgi:threonine dehydratase
MTVTAATEHPAAPDHGAILEAARAIRGQVLRTPMLPAPKLSQLTGAEVFVKYENLQVTGSFKDRGALVKLMSLSPEERRRGVIAMSAGNHAQAVACHAQRLGIRALIVMPENTPFVKVANTEAFGAEVVLAGETVAEARETALALGAEHGYTFVHPYDDPLVIAGQGTLGLEMLEDVPGLDCAVFPIGGGGLISGCATAMKAVKPEIEIFGVETALYPSMKAAVEGRALACGGQTLAEGIAVKTAGALALPVVRRLVTEIILAPEQRLEYAVAAFMTLQKTMAEGAGAAGLAAVLSESERFRGRKVGLVLTGGNIDVRVLAAILVRSLEREHKIMSLRLVVNDLPGTLGRVATCLGACGANIVEVSHRRMFLDVPAKGTTLDLTIEVRDAGHGQVVVAALEKGGFSVVHIDAPATNGSAGL